MASNHQQESIGRRTFVKWAGALGGSAALASSPLLRHVEPSFADTTDDGGFVGNTSAALELGPTGLPYGADKVVPTLCTCGDVCGMLHMGQAYVKDGKIVYYEGCDAAENHGKLCPRGIERPCRSSTAPTASSTPCAAPTRRASRASSSASAGTRPTTS